jgi:hypothetical protein
MGRGAHPDARAKTKEEVAAEQAASRASVRAWRQVCVLSAPESMRGPTLRLWRRMSHQQQQRPARPSRPADQASISGIALRQPRSALRQPRLLAASAGSSRRRSLKLQATLHDSVRELTSQVGARNGCVNPNRGWLSRGGLALVWVDGYGVH